MAKRLQEYVKYTTKELDQYVGTEGSCVRKINTNLHLSLGPFCLDDFKHILMAHLVRSKVGFYDVHLDGIVLDVKKIKVLGTTGAIRADDPRIHVNINADVYVFKPEEGAELTGVVKHIGPHQVGVILYRVFNANLRVEDKVDKDEVQMEQEVKFRIRKYNLQNVFPYIDGELLIPGAEKVLTKGKKIIFKQDDNGDSGIEEKDGVQELDGLLSVIKTEAPSDFEEALEESAKKRTKKSKKAKASSEDSAIAESTAGSGIKKTKRKSSTSAHTEEDEDLILTSSKKIKHELTYSDDNLPSTLKEIKKEKDASTTGSATKKVKRKNCTSTPTEESKDLIPSLTKKNKHEFTYSDDNLPSTPKKIEKEKDVSSTVSVTKKAKRKSCTSTPKGESANLILSSPKKIKHEISSSDNNLPSTPKKIKKEKDASSTKKHKSKTDSPKVYIKVKEEIKDDD